MVLQKLCNKCRRKDRLETSPFYDFCNPQYNNQFKQGLSMDSKILGGRWGMDVHYLN